MINVIGRLIASSGGTTVTSDQGLPGPLGSPWPVIVTDILFAPITTNTELIVASGIVSTEPKTLLEYWGSNESTSEVYVQFFDAVAVPADGTVPTIAPLRVPPGMLFSQDFVHGLLFTIGIVYCSSSTCATKTITAAAITMSSRTQ